MIPDTTSRRVDSAFERQFTTILVLLSGYTVVAAGLLWLVEWLPTFVRIPLALPILLLTPGFAVVTALVPTSASAPEQPDDDVSSTSAYLPEGLGVFERVTLAVVVSIALVPLVTLGVNVVAGIDIGLILAGVSLVTVGATAAAIHRRPTTGTHAWGSSSSSIWEAVPTDRLTVGALVLALLLVGTSAAVSLPGSEEPTDMTEFYVGNTSANGTFVASDYPQSFAVGEEKPYHLKIRSNDDDSRQYEVVALLTTGSGDSAATTELGRTTTTVQPNETATVRYPVEPTQRGENLTLRFLLYHGTAPQEADVETADRVLRISIDVGQQSADTDSTETLILPPVEHTLDNGVTE
ncbi:DUF1616 domain-containing protein [Haloferax namakaokahaiae]|uniref:DUF1616 domain-containing protein n=1 Tax=Haloferax namakaokahaiae TaxID=1748331 RepID=A0ABD5ZJQ7_9EURY